MEIFKLWPPEKIKSPNGKCLALNQHIEGKESVILSVLSKHEEFQRQLHENKEKESTDVLQLEQTNKKLVDNLTDYDRIVSDLMKERDAHKQATEITSKHLANLEFAFNDIHAKYERAKLVVDGFKQNQNVLTDCIAQNEKSIEELQQRYEKLKESSMNTIEEANKQIQKKTVEYEKDMNRLRYKIKTLEITVKSLEACLQQKIEENEQLAMVCDEFIKEKPSEKRPVNKQT